MPQPAFPAIAAQLQRLTPEWDDLCRLAELGRPSAQTFNDLEERAQRLASALVAPFRGPTAKPVNPPLYIERRGDGSTKAVW